MHYPSVAMESPYIKAVNAADFAKEVVARSHVVPVVVDFWAEWCGPCKTLSPILEKLADEYAGGFELAEVDVDANQSLAGQFGVQGIPTIVAFRDGRAVDRFTGALPEVQVRAWLKNLIPTEEDEKANAAEAIAESGDLETAERLYREVLAVDPDHEKAALGLAAILVDADRGTEALEVLEPLPPTPEVERLRATARIAGVDTSSIEDLQAQLAADPDNALVLIHLGRALAAAGRTEEALKSLLKAVELGGDTREEARTAMLDLFQVLGSDHPLTTTFRRKLASALF